MLPICIIHKLLFGTDWPIHRLNGSPAEMVRSFADLVSKGLLLPAELDMIFCSNVRTLVKRLQT